MIEKVARAINKLEGCYEGCNHCKNIARSAIEAMREPTEWMIVSNNYVTEEDAKWVWETMIDAALKE